MEHLFVNGELPSSGLRIPGRQQIETAFTVSDVELLSNAHNTRISLQIANRTKKDLDQACFGSVMSL